MVSCATDTGPPYATIRLAVAAICGSRIASGLALSLPKRRYAACVLAQSQHASLNGEAGDFPSDSAVLIKRRTRRLSPRSTTEIASHSHSAEPVPASMMARASGSSLRDLFCASAKHPPPCSARRRRLPNGHVCVQPFPQEKAGRLKDVWNRQSCRSNHRLCSGSRRDSASTQPSLDRRGGVFSAHAVGRVCATSGHFALEGPRGIRR